MKIIPFKKVFNLSLKGTLVLFAFFSAPHFSYAQEQATEQTPPEHMIEIKAERERFVDYQEAYKTAQKVQIASHGHVGFAVLLKANKPEVRMDNIHVWLESKNKSIPITLRGGNLLLIPIDDEIAAEKGHFAVNKKKGELDMFPSIISLVLNSDWTIGLTKQVINESNIAFKKIVPWYAIPFLPKVKSVGVCTKQAGVEIQIKDGDNIAAIVITKDSNKNDSDEPVFCFNFDKNSTFKDEWRIVVPQSAEVVLN